MVFFYLSVSSLFLSVYEPAGFSYDARATHFLFLGIPLRAQGHISRI